MSDSRTVTALLVLLLLASVPATAQTRPGARYLVIAADSFADILQPLTEWRTATGQQATVVALSVTGSQPSQVRDYIRNAWNTWPVRPEYVLLACNPRQLPGYTYNNDCYYGDMTGDYLMELSVGRLPAWNRSECRVMVSKILSYETAIWWPDTSWLLRGSAVVCEDNPTDPDSLYLPDCYYAHSLWRAGGYTVADTFYNLLGHTSHHLNSALNSGRSFMTYRGVAQAFWYLPFDEFRPGPDWHNGYRTPILVAGTCETVTLAPGEEMLGDLSVRCGSPENLSGAVAYFGTARSDIACSHYRSACYRGFFKALFAESIPELGPATVRGRYRCDSLYRNQYHYEEWTLIGDPGLRVWTGPPRCVTVIHPQWVSAGPQQFTASVQHAGQPASGAFVSLWLDSAVYALDTTDAAGAVLFDISPDHPGRMRVTVTGRDVRPYEGVCEVHVSGAPFVTYLRHQVLDSFPAGNSDGMVGVGETITLPVWVKNFGDSVSRATSARLRISDPYVTLLDTIRSFGTIAGHDSARSLPAGFRFSVSPACPEGRVLGFSLLATDSAGRAWSSEFSISVTAAALTYDRDSVIDDGGNGNGRLDPEETADLVVSLRNDGSAVARQTSAVLRSGDLRLTVLDSTATWGDIPPWSTRGNLADHFTVTALNMVPATPIPCTLVVSALCYSVRIPFSITVGQLSPLDPVADGPRHPVLYWAFDNVDSRYPECPRYEWVELRGTGTQLALGDNQTVALDLPTGFGPFRFYGRRYSQLSVCSNGWVAPGTTTSSSWTNTRLPRNYGPPMLAPCWDDLTPSRGNNVFYQHDTIGHRFIIEWDSVHYRTPADRWETFELVIYDTTLAARDGNSEFDFQYRTAHNFRSATVGIQDPTTYIGITALFDTTYDVAAAPIAPGRCIRFTTDVPVIGIASPEPPAAETQPLSLTLQPNPCHGRVSVSLPGYLDARIPLPLSLFDVSGRQVLTAAFCAAPAGFILDVRHLSAGIYLCRLSSGSAAVTQKLVVR